MANVRPDSRIRVPLVPQTWHTVTFVHWRYDRRALQPMMPAGLTVEEYDGSAWVSLTALQMRDVRLTAVPRVPSWPAFAETNLRTYVRDAGGRQGIWFYSLDAASRWITAGARLMLGMPYFRAAADVEFRVGADVGVGDGIEYRGARAGHGDARYRLHIQPGAPMPPGDLDVWLTHRWRAFSQHLGTLLEIPVRHGPWPLRTAEIVTLQQSLTTAAGLPPPPAEALTHYSRGVADVAFGPARRVRRERRRAG